MNTDGIICVDQARWHNEPYLEEEHIIIDISAIGGLVALFHPRVWFCRIYLSQLNIPNSLHILLSQCHSFKVRQVLLSNGFHKALLIRTSNWKGCECWSFITKGQGAIFFPFKLCTNALQVFFNITMILGHKNLDKNYTR